MSGAEFLFIGLYGIGMFSLGFIAGNANGKHEGWWDGWHEAWGEALKAYADLERAMPLPREQPDTSSVSPEGQS